MQTCSYIIAGQMSQCYPAILPMVVRMDHGRLSVLASLNIFACTLHPP